jgi:hypothetical protein
LGSSTQRASGVQRRREISMRQAEQAIDPTLLERMGRIARGLPGHVVSVDRDEESFEAPPESRPILRIDGVVVGEILAQLEFS